MRGLGAVAQLGEHLLCKQGVVGSNPISSTSAHRGITSARLTQPHSRDSSASRLFVL